MAAERELLRWHDGICILFRSPRNKPRNETSFLATRLPAQPTVRFRLQRKEKRPKKACITGGSRSTSNNSRINGRLRLFISELRYLIISWVKTVYFPGYKICLRDCLRWNEGRGSSTSCGTVCQARKETSQSNFMLKTKKILHKHGHPLILVYHQAASTVRF